MEDERERRKGEEREGGGREGGGREGGRKGEKGSGVQFLGADIKR